MSDPSPETTADPTAGAVATAQVAPDSPAEPAASADTAAATEATEATGNTEAPRRTLRNMSEIRTFFRTNETPIFFIGPTAFNLLGVDRWVRNFSFISYLDSWDGYHPRVFTPPLIDHEEFTSGEDVNNYLLRHPAVRAHIEADPVPGGGKPKVAMVFFDEETERICAEQGYELILPSFELRNHLDSKITTTRLGNEAGAPLGAEHPHDGAVLRGPPGPGRRRGPRRRPRPAVRLRRLGQDDVLRRLPRGLEQVLGGHRGREGQGDEADPQLGLSSLDPPKSSMLS